MAIREHRFSNIMPSEESTFFSIRLSCKYRKMHFFEQLGSHVLQVAGYKMDF